MNLAIILGVSTYIDIKNNLPGCKNDAEAIYNVVNLSEKFDDILYINSDETSAKVKDDIISFISNHKGKTIDELFFYYTGHGEFTNDEFYYVLSDFNIKRKNQTSLQNGEIDDLFRTLNPNLVVKVIDACQSGTTYIKDSDVLTKYFNDKKSGFRKCYFLNSSLNNQSSYQSNVISDFTDSFVNAIKAHTADEIRYKDIIDVISDEFEGNQEQTPFFVIQADYTEKFCFINKELKKYLSSFPDKNIDGNEDKAESFSLYKLVIEDAKNYADKEKIIETLVFVQKEIESFKFSGDLYKLFEVSIDFLDNYNIIPKKNVLSNWLQKNGEGYFADIVEQQHFDEESGDFYKVKMGFKLKLEVPYNTISIKINSKFPNLFSYHCYITYLFSKKSLRFFYFITNYKDDDFENEKLNYTDTNWITNESSITDHVAVKKTITEITDAIEERVLADIDKKFNILKSDEKDENKEDDLTL